MTDDDLSARLDAIDRKLDRLLTVANRAAGLQPFKVGDLVVVFGEVGDDYEGVITWISINGKICTVVDDHGVSHEEVRTDWVRLESK